MPHSEEILDEPLVLMLVFSGNVSGDELVSVNKQMMTKYPDCRCHIWNFSSAVSIEVSPEQMHEIARQDWAASVQGHVEKIAIVGSTQVLRGLDKLYHLFSEKWVGRPNAFTSRTFGKMSEALKWVACEHE